MAGLMSAVGGQGDWLDWQLRAGGAGPRGVAVVWPVGARALGAQGRGFRIIRRR